MRRVNLLVAQAPTPTEERIDFTLVRTADLRHYQEQRLSLDAARRNLRVRSEGVAGRRRCGSISITRTAGREIVAAPFKKAYAFGTIDDIRSAFADRIGEKIERVPINDIDLRYEDGAISSLIRRALCAPWRRGLASAPMDGKSCGTNTARERERKVERNTSYTMRSSYICEESPERVTSCSSQQSGLRVRPAEEVPEERRTNLKMAILGWQHNNKFNQALDSWRMRLLEG